MRHSLFLDASRPGCGSDPVVASGASAGFVAGALDVELAVPNVVGRARGGLPDRPEAAKASDSGCVNSKSRNFSTIPVARLAFVRLVLVLRDPAVRRHDQVGGGIRCGVAVVFAETLGTSITNMLN